MNKIEIFLICFVVLIIGSIAVISVFIYFLIGFAVDSEEPTSFNKQCLTENNFYRSLHEDTDPLTLDNELTDFATKKANQMSLTDSIDTNDNKVLGVNVWSEKSENSEERARTLKCLAAVKPWYGESKKYIYGIPWPSIPFTKHFSQVVWKSTKQLGCAKSYSKKTVFVVCYYRPKGNQFSQYKKNVMKRNGKIVDI